MKKLHKLVVLPLDRTIQKGDIVKNNQDYILNDLTKAMLPNSLWTAQQLLLVSDEELKHNDVALFDGGSRRNGLDLFLSTVKYTVPPIKVIACYPGITSLGRSLPTFSETFIKEWVNNPVMEIEVEYENNRLLNDSIVPFPSLMNELADYADIPKMKLKLTEKNEVICSIPKKDDILPPNDFEEGYKEYHEEKDIKVAADQYANKTMPDATGAMKNMLSEIFQEGIKFYKQYLKSKQ